MVKLTYIPSAVCKNSSCLPHFCQHLVLSSPFSFSSTLVVSHYGFNLCYSDQMTLSTFPYVYWSFECVFLLSAYFRCFPIFHWIGSLFPLTCASLHVLDKSFIMEGAGWAWVGRQRERDTQGEVFFSQSIPCLFSLLMLSFDEQFLILMNQHIKIFSYLVVFKYYLKIFCLP